MRSLIVALLAGQLLGCATQAKYERKLNQWVGRSETELISAFGVPTSTHAIEDGSKFVLYRNRGTAKIGGGAIGPVDVDNHGTTWCETTFKINRQSKVESWATQGNACRSN